MEQIVTFLFIVSFFSGVICLAFLTWAQKIMAKAFSIDYKVLRWFLIIFFVFFAVNFLIYYNEFFVLSPALRKVFLSMFDILLVICGAFCIKLNDIREKSVMKVYLGVGIIYVILWVIAYTVDFSEKLTLKVVMEMMADSVFCGVFVAAMCLCIFIQLRENKDVWVKKYLVFTDAVFCIYICILFCADLYTVSSYLFIKGGVKFPYLAEPLIIAFPFLNIYTVVHFVFYCRKVKSADLSLGSEEEPVIETTEAYSEAEPIINEEIPADSIKLAAADKIKSADVSEQAIESESDAEANSELSAREREVAALAAQGMTNARIAEELCISVYTVKRHMNSIFKKYNVKSRFELLHSISQSDNEENE